MKSKRQAQILEIIARQDIETQNQLMDALMEQGIRSTQATLSRDIKELRLVKVLSANGGYRYSSPLKEESNDHDARLQKIFRECVISLDTAQNIVVIHTLPGLANAAASALDNMEIPYLVGSIAGDDTAFLAMRCVSDAQDFCREIEEMM